jgi:hypothetical protein
MGVTYTVLPPEREFDLQNRHTRFSSGVYAAGPNATPEFHELPPPEDKQVLTLNQLRVSNIQSLFRTLQLIRDPSKVAQ